MNVPKLRFSHFDNEWKYESLINISNDISYGMNSASKEFDGENAYIRITDINENTGKYSKENLVSPDGFLDSKYLVNENDILFARTGASTGKTYLYNKEDGKLYYAGFLIKSNIKKEYNSSFIYQQTKTSKYNRWVKIMSMRSGQPGINSEEYGSYKFAISSIEEQNKIANMLQLLDKKIELQSKKIEALKLYKKGFIKDGSFDKRIRMSDILTEIDEKTTELYQYELLSSTSKGLFLQSEYFNKQAGSENNIGYKVLRKNQLVLSPQNLWMGNININSKYEIGMVSPSYKVFDINNIIDIDYFNYWIKTPRALYDYLISSEQGASVVRRNLNIDMFLDIQVEVPKNEKLLGKSINKLNNKINLEENKLSNIIVLKKGLMQNMFV